MRLNTTNNLRSVVSCGEGHTPQSGRPWDYRAFSFGGCRMKLTKKHVKHHALDALIITAELRYKETGREWYLCILNTALELKQRRAEDKHNKNKAQ
jgi:hypothetical protein